MPYATGWLGASASGQATERSEISPLRTKDKKGRSGKRIANPFQMIRAPRWDALDVQIEM